MTAEIAILNKTAVALAADSAVTLGGKREKIYNSANKLFSLSKYNPVGIMIYGNAQFMGIPWETIIKTYRTKIGKYAYSELKEYCEDFLKFLSENSSFYSESQKTEYIEDNIYSYYLMMREEIKQIAIKHIEKKNKLTHSFTKQITQSTIDKHHKLLEEHELLSDFTEEFIDDFVKQRDSLLEKIIHEIFVDLPLSKSEITKLKYIATCTFCKDIFSSIVSGVVIAGFGREDLFPSLMAYRVEGIVDGKLKYKKEDNKTTNIGVGCSAAITPFAQDEMVHTFIQGINPNLFKFIDNYIGQTIKNYPKILLGYIEVGDKKDELTKLLNKKGNDLFKEFRNEMLKHIRENHIDRILNVVAHLPKDELAALAEALINLTSLKRKITMEAETVGGPIDVAVISRGDGFIWIKRKHYFNKECNLQFFQNYFREDDSCGDDV